MRYQLPPDINKSVQDHLATGKFRNEDEVLREAMELLNLSRADQESIERGIADMQGCRTRPASESNAAFRTQHQIPKS